LYYLNFRGILFSFTSGETNLNSKVSWCVFILACVYPSLLCRSTTVVVTHRAVIALALFSQGYCQSWQYIAEMTTKKQSQFATMCVGGVTTKIKIYTQGATLSTGVFPWKLLLKQCRGGRTQWLLCWLTDQSSC